MKLHLHSPNSGNILVPALFTVAAAGLVLMSYLQMGSNQELLTARSQAWNLAIPVAEAGLEEAMTQLNFTRGSNLANNAWIQQGSKFYKTRTIDADTYFEVTIEGSNPATITATGYARAPLATNFIARKIIASATLTNVIFTKALLARKHIRADKGSVIDSFDSADSKYSASGKYVASKRKDNASIATTGNKKNSIKIKKMGVYGDASVSKKGNVSHKDGAAIGDAAWIDGKSTGIQSGKFSDDFTFDFPDIQPPWTGGALVPSGGKVSGKEYQYILGDGNWELGKTDLKKPILVNGDAVLYVTGDFKAEADIVIDTDASLRFYMGGNKFEIKDKTVDINNGVAAQFQYYALPNNKTVKFKNKGGDFTGVVYAPNAKISIEGDREFVGSVVGKCIHLKHSAGFHYDEAIVKYGTDADLFKIIAWREE